MKYLIMQSSPVSLQNVLCSPQAKYKPECLTERERENILLDLRFSQRLLWNNKKF
jgi:hypothetical protein